MNPLSIVHTPEDILSVALAHLERAEAQYAIAATEPKLQDASLASWLGQARTTLNGLVALTQAIRTECSARSRPTGTS